MKKENLNKLLQEIENITSYFEEKPFTENIKLLKEDFDKINTPNHYLSIIEELSEILRETRILFIYSALNKVCEIEGKLYFFDIPFEASMKYNAVMKKEGCFYIQDEDGDYKEVFTSENFAKFIDDQYWELFQ